MSLCSQDYFLVIDAGSGLVSLDRELAALGESAQGSTDILLSHLHMDHIIGLSAFSPLFDPKKGAVIYTASRDDRPLVSQIFGAFVPPYWPVPLEELVHAECIPISGDAPFASGPFTITPFVANHPDQTTSFHISDGKKTLVYLLDSEIALMNEADYKKLVNYCKDADLVVFDAAYSSEDYPHFRGWGHSTVADGVRLRKDSSCKSILFSHFAQKYSDDEIDSWKQQLDGDGYIFAQDGMEIIL